MTATRVLVIDDSDRRALVRAVDYLALEGRDVCAANSEVGARRRLSELRLDVVILGELGSAAKAMRLLRDLRAGEIHGANAQSKVVTIGADDDSTAVVHYRTGANLALRSTVAPELLSAAVDTVAGLTPAATAHSGERRIGSLTLNIETRLAVSGDRSVRLTRRECELLMCLAETPGRTYSRAEISREVYGSEVMALNSRVIDSHMHRARGKLAELGEADRVQPVWGVGYRLEQ
jgi:DNA-binding response OmpR family regulator